MKKALAILAIIGTTSSFAGLPEMTKIYNHPSIAPKYVACAENIYCNGFTALSKQWHSIPKNYRYKGEWDIRKMAEKGEAEELYRGFSFGEQETTYYFLEAGANAYYKRGSSYKNDLTFARGVAVILYMIDQKGWSE